MARVALLIPTLGNGGLERALILVANSWPATTPLVVTCDSSGPYAKDLADTVKLIDIEVLPTPRTFLRFGLGLHRVLKRERIDVIVVAGFGFIHYVLLARRFGLFRWTRIVVSERSVLSAKIAEKARPRSGKSGKLALGKSKLRRLGIVWVTRRLYRSASAICGVSDGVARDLEFTLDLPVGSVITIYNPVDCERIKDCIFAPVPEAHRIMFVALPRPIIVTAGRLAPEKGHSDLLLAFAELGEHERGSLVILGEGPLRGDLVRQSARLGLTERVWMPGFVDNPWWFIARADVFALSSHWEGFGNVLVETLACGVPVASTDCRFGPREILGSHPGTRLSAVGDYRSLAEAIRQLLTAGETPTTIDLTTYLPKNIACQYHDVITLVASKASAP